jgi:predicted phage terminase large subunit-like protein
MLEQKRKDKTPYWWAAMYQQRPGQFGEASWPAEYFEGLWAEEWPDEFDLSAIAIDPAMGKDKTRGDYQALVFVGMRRDDPVIYVDARLLRVPPPELVDIAISWWLTYHPSVFVCESNGFQDLLGGMIMQQTKETGGALDCQCQPVLAVGNKEIRIEREITPQLARKQIRLRKDSPHTRMLFDQMRAFPNADHDDGPDALALAIDTLRKAYHGNKERVLGHIR